MNVGSTTQHPSSCFLLNYKAFYRQRHREFLLSFGELTSQSNAALKTEAPFSGPLLIGPFQISLLEHAKMARNARIGLFFLIVRFMEAPSTYPIFGGPSDWQVSPG
jgi:hypothetical protein